MAQLAVKRPVSPHVFEVDKPTEFHYKMPINAVSSIATRVSGFALTASAHISPAASPRTCFPIAYYRNPTYLATALTVPLHTRADKCCTIVSNCTM